VDETTMRRHLLAADLALAPFEDTPLVRCKSPLKLAEYMAAGLPVAASEVGEARRMLGAAGVYAPPGDGEALGRAALALVRDAEVRELMSRTAIERASLTYHWRNSVDHLEHAYRAATML
jgi:glycosyltransferase involved in cell wall biosynthesis